jgi:aminotransferase EvaB
LSKQIAGQIPFFDLSRKIMRHRLLIDGAVDRVLSSGNFVLGRECEYFEASFATYVGVQHCVGVANGTDALELALRASGIKAGMKVATAANAGNYATTAASALGAEIAYIDVEFATRNITLEAVQKAVGEGAKAVIATHLYGLAIAEIAEISAFCLERGITLIEDCAQAHGARVRGRVVGSFGDASAFSFYPTKNLGALGDAGAVLTNNDAIASNVRKLRTYGWSEKNSIELPGGRNSRLDEIQAAILSDLLPFLDEDNERRRKIARAYCAGINATDMDLPQFTNDEFAAHLFVLTSENRSTYISKFADASISTSIHFPIPDHLQPHLTGSPEFSLPVTERLARQVMSLPCYPELLDEEVDAIIQAFK